jgi:hypothetical protein
VKQLDTISFKDNEKRTDTKSFDDYRPTMLNSMDDDMYSPSCDKYKDNCKETSSPDCCPSLIKEYDPHKYACYIAENDVGYITTYITPIVPPIEKFIQFATSKTGEKLKYNFTNDDTSLISFAMPMFTKEGVTSMYILNGYSLTEATPKTTATYKSVTTKDVDLNIYAIIMDATSIQKYGDPDIIKVGVFDSSSLKTDGWHHDVTYDTPFHSTEGDHFITVGFLFNFTLDHNNNVSLRIFNSSSSGFSYIKSFGSVDKDSVSDILITHANGLDTNPFCYLSINISKLDTDIAVNNKIKAQVKQGGGDWNGYVSWTENGWKPFDKDDTICVIANLDCGGPTPENKNVPCIMIKDVKPEGFAYQKWYFGSDTGSYVKELVNETFAYIAFSVKHLKDLTDIFPPYLPTLHGV